MATVHNISYKKCHTCPNKKQNDVYTIHKRHEKSTTKDKEYRHRIPISCSLNAKKHAI